MPPPSSSLWLDLIFDNVGDDVRISARGSRGENLLPRPLGITREALLAFATDVKRAAAQKQALPNAAIAKAHAIQEAVLADDIGKLFRALREANKNPLVLRFLVPRELQSVPWEALCNPGESLGFWGTLPDVLLVRGVPTFEQWKPREVRSAVKVLAIAPTGDAGMTNLRGALDERITTGEVEWLDPVTGLAAKTTAVTTRLGREPVPNVLHFLGHGGLNAKKQPSLRMSDEDDEEKWLPVELVVQSIPANYKGTLRLVVLEACDTAAQSDSQLLSAGFTSAAEILAQSGADAVVAFSWPVRAETALLFSTKFYQALTGKDRSAADVAYAVNEARRAVITKNEGSAEALNPVVYMRGCEGRIFDFTRRTVVEPRPSVTISAEAGQVPSSLARIVRAPFSLVLGDRWKNDREALDTFRNKLQQELAKISGLRNGLPMGTLAQWFALHRGAAKLGNEFQRAFRASMQAPAVVATIARLLQPGVHTTLLRNAWLEQGLAEHHPDRTIFVIQPQDGGALILKREARSDDWEELFKAPADVNLDEDFLVLRPYRGYTPDEVLTTPLLTEDDYHLRLPELWNPKVVPVDFGNAIRGTLSYRPALILGLSMLTANHRMLLHTLYGRALPPTSLAVVDGDDREGSMWKSGAGLPGKDEGIEVLEISADVLQGALEAMVEEAGQ